MLAAMQIHELSATELLAALNTRQTSSVEVVQALMARSADVDPQVRAFIQRFDERALAEAAKADAARAKGEHLGPLHGLPVSIKENIDIAGTDSTLGLKSRQGKPAAQDAVVVQLLREAGAIVLGKTNVPQLLLAVETENSIWGITRNPWNLERSPGGSSGGEAAAVATGQSPLGIGTDIGGSIRIPAHFCGIYGLKPTLDRWSNRGSQGAIPGQEMVRSQMGPLARSAADIALVMQALDPLRQSPLDPAVAPLGIGRPEAIDLSGLRVGFFLDDGYLTPAASVQRAVRMAVDALRDAGATIVEYTPPCAQDLLYVWLGTISSDGGATMEKLMAGEEVCRQIKPSMRVARMPGVVRKLAASVLAGRKQERMARLLRSLGPKPVDEVWRLTAERTVMRRAEFDAWNAAGLDLVLCPPHALPAMPIGSSGDLTLTLSYSFRYVMLNFPAGVAPVTRVRDDELQRPQVTDTVEKRCAEVEAQSDGLPVGVQVVARPFREDLVLAAMAAIEARVKGEALYPRTPCEPIGK